MAVAVALLPRLIIWPLLGPDLPFLFFWPAVMCCAWYGGLGPGLVATVLSALAGRFFLLEPVHSLMPAKLADAIGLLLYLLLGTSISFVIEEIHQGRRRIERHAADLYDQRERFRVTLTSIGDAVIATDRKGRIAFMNSIAEQLTGWTDEEARQQPLEMVLRIVNEQTRNTAENPVQKVLQSGSIVGLPNHTVLLRKDGAELPIDDSAAPIRDPQGEIDGVVLVFRDVTERRKLENEVQQRSEQLVMADRRKNEFISMLEHELRNVVAPILSGIELVRHFGGTEPHVREAADMIGRQSQVMQRLVADLMDNARISQGKVDLRRQTVDLIQLAKQAVETSRPLIDARQHILTVHEPEEPIWLEADPARLIQIVTNLLNNAAKYTPDRGHIWLTVERNQAQGIVRVRDSGIGINKEMLGYVFDLYAQSQRAEGYSQGGLGIGLNLVRGLTELHGGTVEVFSEGVGRGSEFVVRLPLKPAANRGPARPRGVLAIHQNPKVVRG